MWYFPKVELVHELFKNSILEILGLPLPLSICIDTYHIRREVTNEVRLSYPKIEHTSHGNIFLFNSV